MRLSLRVTHPNVCRVFDIERALDGRHFLSMEYVDGEDLASLLRRIGRLPEDKAIEIARQLCAGLAAAHDEGVLHRDLKPANIMIDGRGRAKITDFGLAGATAGISGREARAGTPQYMAPEQVDGRRADGAHGHLCARPRALRAVHRQARVRDQGPRRSATACTRRRRRAPRRTSAASIPLVERAILRCLDPDPAKRPASASRWRRRCRAAIRSRWRSRPATRRRPSSLLRPAEAANCGRRFPIACLRGPRWSRRRRVPRKPVIRRPRIGSPTKPPAELQVAARAALGAAGYTQRGKDYASGFVWDEDYFRKSTRLGGGVLFEKADNFDSRWAGLATVDPPPLWFWYREAQMVLVPVRYLGSIDVSNPPLLDRGMTRVRLDRLRRLQELVAVAPEKADTPGPWPEPDWVPLFAAAGLVQSEWKTVEPEWMPFRGSVDVRRAWTKGNLRIEATSFRGRPSWFRVVPDWRQPVAITDAGSSLSDHAGTVYGLVVVLFILGGALIARRNLRQDRGDRRGAFRLAAVYICVGAAVELTELNSHASIWLPIFGYNFAFRVLLGVIVWLAYLAVEPYVRRFWPGTLVAWSRVVEGRFRDPLVGRHVLLGALAGLTFTLLDSTSGLDIFRNVTWSSDRLYLGAALKVLLDSLLLPVSYLLGLLVLRIVFRRPWIVYAVIYFVTLTLSVVFMITSGAWLNAVSAILYVSLALVLLARLGLLAMVVAVMFASWQSLP